MRSPNFKNLILKNIIIIIIIIVVPENFVQSNFWCKNR